MASEDTQLAQTVHRRALHGKRSFRHGLAVDSPLYDASEEDNDETGDDTASAVSIASPNQHSSPNQSAATPRQLPSSPLSRSNLPSNPPGPKQSQIRKVQGAAIPPSSLESDGVDSPTYDGDIESSTTAAPVPSSANKYTSHHRDHSHTHQLSSSTFTPDSPNSASFPAGVTSATTSTASSVAATPSTTQADIMAPPQPTAPPVYHRHSMSQPSIPPPVEASVTPAITISSTSRISMSPKEERKTLSIPHHHPHHELAAGEPEPADATMEIFDPSALTPDEIQKYVKDALEGTGPIPRKYKPNPPPTDRAIRIYADGVYDIFHFGHALQLRQAKLSFPSVHLLVGVCSDELCQEHKSRTVMSHAERCESVRHCRWVDEILSDAPWVIDQAFLDKHQIDYVAHDEDPYKGSDGSDDVYDYVKRTGHFIPTRRTPGVSTSELLERMVRGYRDGQWDAKLDKMGYPELKAEGSEFGSRAPSRAPSRPESRLK
ncbi:hypothetical protein FRC03_012850 [Tulasnella sp. 419]|nr:hypothetical protein FRC02_006086 [Tulasnella sp. 418]KAG8950506.1 hypothetical protein FRC03_012850 [Tulasnella sp. 419]